MYKVADNGRIYNLDSPLSIVFDERVKMYMARGYWYVKLYWPKFSKKYLALPLALWIKMVRYTRFSLIND